MCSTAAAFASTREAVPSLIPDELPAVTNPSLANAAPQTCKAFSGAFSADKFIMIKRNYLASLGQVHRSDLVFEISSLTGMGGAGL